jgi:predicted nucleic-acid-binding Zn-ribbon protein
MAKNIQTTYIRHGNKVKCPKCQSTNVKSLKTQPKKYPKPTESSSGIDFEELMNFYKNGYSCNKCGNHFIAYFEADHPLKKPSIMVRFFKLMIYIILFSAFFWLVFS